jgi:hypothetical protein
MNQWYHVAARRSTVKNIFFLLGNTSSKGSNHPLSSKIEEFHAVVPGLQETRRMTALCLHTKRDGRDSRTIVAMRRTAGATSNFVFDGRFQIVAHAPRCRAGSYRKK